MLRGCEFLVKNDELLTVFKDIVIIRDQAIDDGSSKAYASILARKP